MTTTTKQPKGMCQETVHGLDQLSILPFINGSLSQIMDTLTTKFGNDIPQQCSNDIKMIKQTLTMVHKEGTRVIAKVSSTPHALGAYNTKRRDEPLAWQTAKVPPNWRTRQDAYRVKSFHDEHKESTKRDRESTDDGTEPNQSTPPEKKQRKSNRIVTPNKVDQIMSLTTSCDVTWTKKKLFEAMRELIGTGNIQPFVNSILACNGYLKISGMSGVQYTKASQIYRMFNEEGGFTGLPPEGHIEWEKEDLCHALSKIEKEADNTITMNAFKRAVVEKGRSGYGTINAITKMYNKWKKNGRNESPSGRGRPAAIHLNELRNGLDEIVEKGGLGDRNTITHKHVAQVIEKKRKQQAEADGLDPETVDVTVHNKTSQMYLVASGMSSSGEDNEDNIPRKLSDKSHTDKTITRWIAEHSTMAAMSNTCTCLATHAIVGVRPPELGGPIDYDKLSDDVKETFEMTKDALGADDVYFVHPSCIMSTDDSRVFAFEGAVDSNGEWRWVLINESGDGRHSGTDSHFKVSNNAGKKGGISVKITHTFTAAAQIAPIYVAVTGLTEKELDPKICPSGFLPKQVPNLCKGGYDVHANGGFGWIVFQRADSKKSGEDGNISSVASQKFDHYNNEVLIPFIRKIRESLGWVPGTPIPEWLKVCCWCDGDIPQLQSMLIEANEKLDEMENIVRNKHPAAGTARYQPADLNAFFKILHFVSDRTTAKNNTQATAFKNTLMELFNGPLKAEGLNLSLGAKNGLIDLLACFPKILEENATMENLSNGFVAGGMISKADRRNPSYNALMSCNRKWGSANKARGVSKEDKDNCKRQFAPLMKIQLSKGQLTAEDMLAANLPKDTDPDGRPVDTNKPSGDRAEHRQYAKNMNNEWQRRNRHETYARKAEEKYKAALDEYDIIRQLLSRNKAIEETLIQTVASGSLADVDLESFLNLGVAQLKDFIHCRKFNGKTFQETKLYGSDRKLNKTLTRNQTAAEMEAECSFDRPCLVWLAWKLREEELVLKPRQQPVLQVLHPQSSLSFENPLDAIAVKNPSEYLRDAKWREAAELSINGVTFCDVTDEMAANADKLLLLMKQRLKRHIAIRLDDKSSDHMFLKFTRDNLSTVVAQMCFVGHVVSGVETSSCDDRLLVLPNRNTFLPIGDSLGKLEGCYLCHDRDKDKWIRSGFAGGLGTCFESRIKKHKQNSRSSTAMRTSRFYRYYPSKDAHDDTSGSVRKGYFEDLEFFCGMACNPEFLQHLCSVDKEDSLFVWSNEYIAFLNKMAKSQDVTLERMQLKSVQYLWEICYDLPLAASDNISDSFGAEGLGLRSKK